MLRAWFRIVLLGVGMATVAPAGIVTAGMVPGGMPTGTSAGATVTAQLTLDDPAIQDQDDLCVWLHPDDLAQSTLITSDKVANRLFVYDLDGVTVQALDVPGKPGNIDLRYAFPWAEGHTDIAVFNDRTNDVLVVLAIDPATRQLSRIDSSDLSIGANYGLCLYRSPTTGRFFVFVTRKTGVITQYRLQGASGTVTLTSERSWNIGGQTEGCVCDDEMSQAYFGEEDVAIWKIGAEPADATSGFAIATVGDASGLTADVEGLSIYYAGAGTGYVLASSQGNSTFKVYDRMAPHAFATSFSVVGASSTDGIDVTNLGLGTAFPSGIFACHNNGTVPRTVEVCRWEDLGLTVDTTSWDPRGAPATPVPDQRNDSWGRMKSRFR